MSAVHQNTSSGLMRNSTSSSARPTAVAAARVLHALRRASGTRRVENKQWMLGIDPFRLALRALAFDQLMQHVSRPATIGKSRPCVIDDDVFHGLAAAQRQRFIDDGFQCSFLPPRNCSSPVMTATAPASMMAFLQRFGREAAEDNGVGGADARARCMAATPSTDIDI